MGYPEQLAYVSGVIDGEGTITIGTGGNGQRVLVPFLCISNTNTEIIDYCRSIIGGSVTVNNKNYKGTKPLYLLRIKGRRLSKILKVLLPYLQAKRINARLVLKFLKLRLDRPLHGGYTKEEIKLANEIRALNGNGGRYSKAILSINDFRFQPAEAELRELYIDQQLSRKEIATKFNKHVGTIIGWLHSYAIFKNERKEEKASGLLL